MKKVPQAPKPAKKTVKDDLEMEGPFAEKDEVKKAESKMRKASAKNAK